MSVISTKPTWQPDIGAVSSEAMKANIGCHQNLIKVNNFILEYIIIITKTNDDYKTRKPP